MGRAEPRPATDDAAAPEPFGFTWGRTDDIVWLRNARGAYKRIHPELLRILRELAEGRRGWSELDEPVARSVEQLRNEGFLVPGAPVVQWETPPDIALAPRVIPMGLALAGLAVVVALRWDVAWPPPADPRVNLWAVPFFFVAAFLHELGHFSASLPYFRPTLRFGMLNRVFPALITRTADAWVCPRNVRIWINLAGPCVDVALTVAVAALHLLVLPEVEVLSTLILVQFLRVLMVLNPLVEGDGYWCLVDALGVFNLRSRGFRDLRQRRWTRPALYAAASLVFIAVALSFAVTIFVNVMILRG